MANSQSYLTELCLLLGVQRPEPKQPDESRNDYVFERMLSVPGLDGKPETKRIDLYKRGCFILESKQGTSASTSPTDLPLFGGTGTGHVKRGIGFRGSDAWHRAMRSARTQAEAYGKALPKDHGWPPFLLVVDVGYCIEMWANFAMDGKAYTQFPDRNRFRIFHDEAQAKGAPTLRDPWAREQLARIWSEPLVLDPSRHAASVTRDIAGKLADLARSLEKRGRGEANAEFLMRCLFCMFAEDIGLLPKDSFTSLLVGLRGHPEKFAPMMTGLWKEMDQGRDLSMVLQCPLRAFNGKFFRHQQAWAIDDEQLELLIAAAKADWSHVEPAIFGTLLERALEPEERHKLGAHYTPRAYVERLVLPTIIEPLRADWLAAQKEADLIEAAGGSSGREKARQRILDFHQYLCRVRVLDPACGSGNFLYVTLEHMKRLEGEVLQRLADFDAAGGAGQITSKEGGGEAVHPRQFLGIEVNHRAAAIAEMVLWIGYLQWQARTLAATADPDLRRKLESRAVLEDLRNIECRDAVLAWDRIDLERDEHGKPLTRWDGKTTKPHPVTGKSVPDETARVAIQKYVCARRAEWPKADFVVGNPPFLGNKRMRQCLGDGYVEALRRAWSDVPDTVDLVMYWWANAARLARAGAVRRFGFITTNSITQTFNRKTIATAIGDGKLRIAFAIPDHPWVDSEDGAAVRVAMTAATSCAEGALEGRQLEVVSEEDAGLESVGVRVGFSERPGLVHADLSIGPNVAGALSLKANRGVSFQGYVLVGERFVLSLAEHEALAGASDAVGQSMLRPWKNGRDLLHRTLPRYVIDCFGWTQEDLRNSATAIYQHLLVGVKPFRDQVARKNHRERWWIWGEARPGMRRACHGLARVVVTNFAAKHRVFLFESPTTALDHNIYVIATDDPFVLGVLSSRLHVTWMLAAGSTLEDRPLWLNSTCFLPFPFPARDDSGLVEHVRDLGEQLDAHRKRQQAPHPDLTITGMYNVLEALREGRALTATERAIHDKGLVSILKQIHDELDAAVFDAYGWPRDLDDEGILQRLVDLNAQRADEERRGIVRWLRPDFQAPKAQAQTGKADLGLVTLEADEDEEEVPAPKKLPRPKNPAEAVAAIHRFFAGLRRPVTVEDVAAQFDGWRPDAIDLTLRIAESYGDLRELRDGRWASG